jgi:hypothetical protein
MRKFSGITHRNSPDAITTDRLKIGQTDGTETNGKGIHPCRNGLDLQPYRTEYRTIFK